MTGTRTDYGEQRTQPHRAGVASPYVGAFLTVGDPLTEAAGLVADLQALLDAGLIRRVHAGGEIRFELTELGASTAGEE